MTAKVEAVAPARRNFGEYYRTFLSRHSSLLPTFAAIAILILLFIGAEIFLRGDFISPGNISALLLDNAFLLILAVGMTFVILTAGIDLSVGSVMAFTGIWLAKLLEAGTSLAIALPLIILGGALIGLLIGVLVQFFDVQPFIASLAGLFLARGLAFVVSLSSIKVETASVLWLQSTRFRFGDWYITPTGILALFVVLVGAYVMQYTRFGRTTYAVGGNKQAALMGLKVARTTVSVYVISGVCGGLAGLVLDRIFRRRLSAQWRRHGTRCDRSRGHWRDVAEWGPWLCPGLIGRRARVRDDQDHHFFHGCRAVLDADCHRRPAPAFHRGPAGDRRPVGPTEIALDGDP